MRRWRIQLFCKRGEPVVPAGANIRACRHRPCERFAAKALKTEAKKIQVGSGQVWRPSRSSLLGGNGGPGIPAQFLRAYAIGADEDLAEVAAITKSGFSRDDFQGVAAALDHGACRFDT